MLQAAAQEIYTLSGEVIDKISGEPLYSAAVQISPVNEGKFTDEEGVFQIRVTEGVYTIAVSYLGYHSYQKELVVSENKFVSIALLPADIVTEEVVISSQLPDQSLESTAIGKHILQAKDLQELTYMLGEVDPLRAIQLLPGVQSMGEGGTGFFVRGGAADQNLIVLDGAPIYNASHLFGFFSVFNGSTIGKMELLKAGMSAKYGGRLSSYLKIDSKTPNKQQVGGEASMGVIAGGFYIEAPLVKEKLSVSVAGRRTYLDLLNKSVLKNVDYASKDLNYYFYDINGKLDYQHNKDKISLSFYTGADNFQYLGKVKNHIIWKNSLLSANWNRAINQNLTTHFTAYLSNYDLNFGASIHTYSLNLFSFIKDRGAKASAFYVIDQHHEIEVGGELIYHNFLPNKINALTDEHALNFGHVQQIKALEYGAFINSSHTINEKLQISIGIRHSGYWQLGPFERFVTDANFLVTDTLVYDKKKTVSFYQNIEPRLALRYKLNEKSSFKASYDYNTQYVHMVPMSSVSLPSDMWVPSSELIKPQEGRQFSLGYFRNFKKSKYESSIAVYYKRMDNQIEYRNGVIIGYSKGHNFDDNYYFGQGFSKGLEVFLKKNEGRFTGALSYTLAKTDKQFEGIDEGKVFPAKYDRRHDISINSAYKISEKWKLMGIFVYATGNALTLPVGRYIINGNIVNEYGDRNQFRMPAYHRMDISVEYTFKPTARFASSLILSCFNVYNRKNPYYIYFDVSGNLNEYQLSIEPVQVALFTFIPSITYHLKLL